MTTFILLAYLSTASANSGMATLTAEYTTEQKCIDAGKAAKKTFEGWATSVRFTCNPK